MFCKNCNNVSLKRPKINDKRGLGWPNFLKNHTYVPSKGWNAVEHSTTYLLISAGVTATTESLATVTVIGSGNQGLSLLLEALDKQQEPQMLEVRSQVF